jgi:hypothetical protein
MRTLSEISPTPESSSLLFVLAPPVRIGLDVEWLLRAIEAGKRTCIKQIIGLHLSLRGGLR